MLTDYIIYQIVWRIQYRLDMLNVQRPRLNITNITDQLQQCPILHYTYQTMMIYGCIARSKIKKTLFINITSQH